LGIDHLVGFDESGIWSRNNQKFLEYGSVLVVTTGALWLGDLPGLGHTFWQAADSMVLSGAVVAVLKPTFSRSRPSQSPDPDLWFQGHGHNSFPSGEVALVTATVTPFVLQYGAEHPVAYALELLPLYDAIARVKSHAHWQTDVLASYALGSLSGYYTHERSSSFLVQTLPRGVTIGWHTQF
jgi:undecaprenyl-diphosphatase